MPLWLDLGGLRAVHANWDDRLVGGNPGWQFLNPELLRRSVIKDGPEFEHCETLMKGTEADLPEGFFFTDKEDIVRTRVRLKWWLAAAGRTYNQLCMPESDTVPHVIVPETAAYLPAAGAVGVAAVTALLRRLRKRKNDRM